jgi:protein phosphatase
VTILRVGSATDVGMVRKNNEDDLLVADPVFAVADGMGGHAGGEVASRTAVEALERAFAERPHTVDGLIEAIEDANRAVFTRAVDDPDLRGMGTTLTVLAVVVEEGEEHVAIANVGDSRVYLLRDGELGMLTDDHSVAEQLVREGRLTPEEAAVHPQRHVLTRVLGIGEDVAVDAYPILPYRGDRFLLCSDGLINEVSEAQIGSLLRRLADPGEAARELVNAAKANGGHDNITVVVVDVVDDDDRSEVASAALEGEIAGAGTAGVSAADARASEDVDSGPAGAGAALVDAVAAPVTPEPESKRRSRREKREHRPRVGGRRITFRVVLFFVLLLALLGATAAAIGWYARGGYFVGLNGGEVVIFKGRPGGMLWFDPTIERRTGMPEADVPAVNLPDVQSGKEESSLAAATRYVDNLQAQHQQLTGGGPTSTTTTVVGAPSTTAPTTAAPTPTTAR